MKAHESTRRGRTPGFTAEASCGAATRTSHRRAAARARRGAVEAQLGISPFRPRGGGFSTIGDYWTCKDACAATHRTCLDGCEGTVASPKGSSNCTICDDNYRSCVQGCARDIA